MTLYKDMLYMAFRQSQAVTLFVFAAVMLVCGNTAQPPAWTREYRGTPADRAILACERALYSFTDTFTVIHRENGMRATAPLPGTDTLTIWDIRVEQGQEDLTRVAVSGNGSPAVYRLFHARLSYVLGLRPDVLSCDDALQLLDYEKAGADGLAPLCSLRGGVIPAPLPQRTPNMPQPECNECP